MKICLIDPPGVTKGLNLGLGYLASSLIEEGHELKVIDLNNNPDNIEERLSVTRNYDLVGISIKSFTVKSACEISKMVPRNDIICGGPHIILDGYNFLRKNQNFSLGVTGEGEKVLVEVAKALESDSNLQDVKGILYKDKREILVNPKGNLVTDLDSLPFPNYEVFDSSNRRITRYPLMTSRGCPYSCIYCCVGEISGKKWRYRTPENIILELEEAKSRWNSKRFSILDDNFTQNPERAKRFCKLLLDRDFNMRWTCSNGIRADRLDQELARLMKKAGCDSVSLGIESLDETVFNNIKKGEKLSDIKEAISLLKKEKIKVTGFFMIGLPGDNMQKTRLSIELARKLKLDEASWSLLVPYPGTEVWRWVNEKAKIIRDWEEGFHFGPNAKSVFETEDFTEKEKAHAYNLANTKCKAYPLLLDNQKPFLAKVLKILRLILTHDAKYLPFHLLYALKEIRRVYKFR